jgi:hypothetical protein
MLGRHAERLQIQDGLDETLLTWLLSGDVSI